MKAGRFDLVHRLYAAGFTQQGLVHPSGHAGFAQQASSSPPQHLLDVMQLHPNSPAAIHAAAAMLSIFFIAFTSPS